MSEPTPLAYEQFLPLAVALHRRETYTRAGAGFLLPPLPNCPTCDQPAAELAPRQDDSLLTDRIRFGFQPCGHAFTVDGEDAFRASDAARHIVANEETP